MEVRGEAAKGLSSTYVPDHAEALQFWVGKRLHKSHRRCWQFTHWSTGSASGIIWMFKALGSNCSTSMLE